MKRLVVVSNRVADLSNPTRAGGLAVAVGDALKEHGGIWVGWDGRRVSANARSAPNRQRVGGVTTITFPLRRKDYAEYYAGFANSVLWPLVHYRLDLVTFRSAYLNGYRRVNAMFADVLSPLLEHGDVIWVHDYHLIPLASELRNRGHAQPIGFFLHTPFPPPDILAAVPQHDWLIRSLFDYDLVGFQTSRDLGNFRRYIEDYLAGGRGGDDGLTVGSKTVRAGCYPIGIDAETVAAMAHTPAADEQIEVLHRRTLARRLIIGVDRLDYSKGLPGRLMAFRRLLERYPENLKTVTFMQIAPPTRGDVEAYADIRAELESLSGQINGHFADFDWTPLRYIHRVIPRDTLAALYRGSQVGFVSPLRDGMNLVAKEFVAAQDADDPGVLVLSKFAGAAEDLKEAVIVNPYDTDAMAESLQRALTMPREERISRHTALARRVRERDAAAWQSSFLADLRREPGAAAA